MSQAASQRGPRRSGTYRRWHGGPLAATGARRSTRGRCASCRTPGKWSWASPSVPRPLPESSGTGWIRPWGVVSRVLLRRVNRQAWGERNEDEGRRGKREARGMTEGGRQGVSEWVSLAVEGSIHASALQQQQSGLVAGWLGRGLLGPGLGRPTDKRAGRGSWPHVPASPPPTPVRPVASRDRPCAYCRTGAMDPLHTWTRPANAGTAVRRSRRQSTTDLLSSELTVDVLHEGSWQRPTAGRIRPWRRELSNILVITSVLKTSCRIYPFPNRALPLHGSSDSLTCIAPRLIPLVPASTIPTYTCTY